jgi:chemotaxis protein methyltransferase CheR
MELSNRTLLELTKLIHRWSGLAIGGDKAYLVRHRLAPLVRSNGLEGFDELLLKLQSRGTTHLHDAVVEAITTKETSFFRDPWLFDALLQRVLPELASTLKGGGGRHRIRIWSAGTSTGQEAYSLAMVVREFIDGSRGSLHDHHFNIIASDISSEAIETAKAGSYSKADVDRGVSESRLRRYLTRRGDRWLVSDSLRPLVQFRKFNLLHPPAELGAFDLVLCRNVLIYFDEPTRARVCQGVHRVVNAGGWLALGSAESLYGIESDLETIKLGRAVVYHKLRGAD